MRKQYHISLTDEQRTQLVKWTKNPPKHYLRKRAYAILEVASGKPISHVARDRRVRVHRTTVSEWVQRFLEDGLEGLKIKPGRGRKPAFSPSERGGGAGRS